MKILLVDIDSKIPNLALMKLSTFHKNKGDEVSLIRLFFNGYPSDKPISVIDNKEYDLTYASNIFSVNKNRFSFKKMSGVSVGGTGQGLINLPEEVDDSVEDYSIYPTNKVSFGFITRGCPRKCSFCIVPEKEGGIYHYRSIEQIVKHKKVFFMDNNILAYEKHTDIFKELIEKNIRCQFNQGLDIRLITEENAELLGKLNYMGEYTFAFDHISLMQTINKKIKIIKKYIKTDWRCRMFILGGWDSSLEDDLSRILWCRDHKIKPYYMRHEKCWESEHRNFYISLASWCNQPSLFKSLSFQEFMAKRTTNKERSNTDIKTYSEVVQTLSGPADEDLL